jgi:glycosyltransferase involved in cell wall biosynthesis
MKKMSSDIIVSVWNRPVETRNCLVNLIENSPDSRFIIVDNGSDRETERMLEEFADGLDHRAILLRNDVNQGYVRAVNRGLARSDADYLVIVRNTSIVTPSWLETMISLAGTRSDAGIIVPRLVRGHVGKQHTKGKLLAHNTEEDHGSLSAMMMTRKAYDAVGGIDEDMEGGIWCLRDLSRRAFRSGYLTFRVDASVVSYEDDIPLGSTERRKMALQKSMELYRQRWGEPQAFCVSLPKGADMNILRQRIDVLLTGARQGHFFSLLLHGRLYDELSKSGLEFVHQNIRFIKLPMFFESRVTENALNDVHPEIKGAQAVAGIEGIPFSKEINGIPFRDLEASIVKASKEFYGA